MFYYWAIFLGGGLGALARFSLGMYIAEQLIKNFSKTPAKAKSNFLLGLANHWIDVMPIATLSINIIGSFFIGLLMPLLLERDWHGLRLFMVVGLLGGFTTFSGFAWESLGLWQKGLLGEVLLYSLASVVFTIIFAAIGFSLAQLLWG